MSQKRELAHVSGEPLNRFVLYSALLRLIDPVRGEPTRSTLDGNPEGGFLGSWQLKQKFLDSFALIGSTSSSGAITATAVCLETHEQAGNIIRIARNHGLTSKALSGLERVLQVLREVSRKEKPSTQAESEILDQIAELDRDRILEIAKRIEKRGIRHFLQQAHSQVSGSLSKSDKFRLWLEKCPFTASPSTTQNWSHATIAVLIKWASEARWQHDEQIQTLLELDKSQNRVWLDYLHKVARYHCEIKSMVKLAVKEPGIFMKISIRGINAPNQRQFKLPDTKAPLLAVVRNLVGEEDANSTMEQLEKHLNTRDAEEKLRMACRLDLTLHAEMQMVVFYESHPQYAPRMRIIGTSKKACFLCDRFLRQHPLRLQASACHQKIYPSWRPPPYYKVPGKFAITPFMKLCDELETLTRRELKTALNVPRRPPNWDSTAGPSLTLTATVPTEPQSLRECEGQSTFQDYNFSEDSDSD